MAFKAGQGVTVRRAVPLAPKETTQGVPDAVHVPEASTLLKEELRRMSAAMAALQARVDARAASAPATAEA